MRKRLLIKNFVAQMLQQERPQVYLDEGLEFTFDELKAEEEQEEVEQPQEVEQGNLDVVKQDSDEEEEDTSDEEDDQDEFADGSTAMSMVHRPTEVIHYGDSTMYYVNEEQPRVAMTPLPSASTLCSNSSTSSIEPMWEDGTDSFSLLSLTATGQSRSFNDPMMAGQDENIFYPGGYQGQYMMTSASGATATTNSVSLGGYMTVEHNSEGFIEEVNLCDKLDKLHDDYSEDEVSLSNGTCFTSLVNVNSPVKAGNDEMLAYRRSITDLDTNTVVEEDFDGGVPPTSTETSCGGASTRSPKKRPLPFAQDDFYNLTLSSSPKRLKL